MKHSRTVSLSAERVLESLEQKGDETGDIYRSKYKMSCVTVLLRKLAQCISLSHLFTLVLAIQSTTVIELILLEFINFNRNGIRLPRETFSISKAKTLKLYLFICLFL